MKIGYIYKITSPTGRIYIGQTINLKRRMQSYSNLRCKQQILIYNSLAKYGWENHKFEIIYKTFTSKEELNTIEIFFISFFKSNYYQNKEYGLNLTSGGNIGGRPVGYKCLDSTKKKIGDKNRNRMQTEEFKLKQLEGLRKKFKEPEFKKRMGQFLKPKPGELNNLAKITEKQAIEIIAKLNLGCRICNISKDLDISQSIITNIKTKVGWKHLSHLLLNDVIPDKTPCPRKITKEIEVEIEKLYSTGEYTQNQIAKMFNVSRRTIWVTLNKNK